MHSHPTPLTPPLATPPGRLASPPPRTLTSDSLLGNAPEVLINHHGAVYRLRITSLGKLILTK